MKKLLSITLSLLMSISLCCTVTATEGETGESGDENSALPTESINLGEEATSPEPEETPDSVPKASPETITVSEEPKEITTSEPVESTELTTTTDTSVVTEVTQDESEGTETTPVGSEEHESEGEETPSTPAIEETDDGSTDPEESTEVEEETVIDLNTLSSDELFDYLMTKVEDINQFEALYEVYPNLDELMGDFTEDQEAQLDAKFNGDVEDNIELADATEEETAADKFVKAIEAGGTITLDKDITFHNTATIGGDVVIDLNGHTLKYEYKEGTSVISSDNTRAGIYGSSKNLHNLTIKDSSSDKKGVFEITGSYGIYGSFKEVQILNATFRGDYGNPICFNEFTKLTLENAKFEYSGGSRFCYGSDAIIIKDCTFNGGVSVSGKTLEVTGNTVFNSKPTLKAIASTTLSGNVKFNKGVKVENKSNDVQSNCEIKGNVYSGGGLEFGPNMNVTINGGTFEQKEGMLIEYGVGSTSSSAKFIINGGTFYQKGDGLMGSFYQCAAPIINGGVFKTDSEAIYFAVSWSAGSAVNFNGGYYNKPLEPSSVNDNTTPKFNFPSGYGFSTDTLGKLTGDTTSDKDYYWITKSIDVTYNMNHTCTSAGNTTTYTGKAYTTYASNSMLASDSSTTYTAYNPNIPYRSGDYSFNGWTTTSDASSGSLIVSGLSENSTLYAVWKEEATKYTVAYDLNGGNGSNPESQTGKITANSVQMPTSNGFSRANYVFNGWTLSADSNETIYKAEQEVSVSDIAKNAKMVGGVPTITLYAVWKAKETITFQDQTHDYTGQPIAYDVTKNNKNVGDGFTVKYYSDDKYTDEINVNEVIEPKYYYILIERAEDEKYAAVSAKKWLKITPKGSLSVQSGGKSKEYDGKPYTCTFTIKVNGSKIDPESIGATVRYSTDRNTYTLETAPTYTDVISYKYVYVLVTAPGYKAANESKYVNITKANTTITLSGLDTAFYDGNSHGLSATVTNSKGTVIKGAVPTITYYTDDKYTNKLVGEPVDVGIYYVKAILEETSNYNAATATGTLTINKVVAKIDDTSYASLQDAINEAKDGQTIVLQDDISINTISVSGNKTITLDANGKTITQDFSKYSDADSYKCLIDVSSGANLIIKGNGKYVGPTIAEDVEKYNAKSLINVDGGESKVTIYGGTFSTDVTDYLAEGYNILKVKDNEYTVSKADSKTIVPVDQNKTTTPAVEQKTVETINEAIKNSGTSGTVTIKDDKGETVKVDSSSKVTVVLESTEITNTKEETGSSTPTFTKAQKEVVVEKALEAVKQTLDTNKTVSASDVGVIPLDITLKLNITTTKEGEQPSTTETKTVTELSTPITVTLYLNNETMNKLNGKQVNVVRIHDGETEVLKTTLSGNALSFETNKFSTYVITYTEPKAKETKQETVSTKSYDAKDKNKDGVISCQEEMNSANWTWSETKKACVYRVTNTSAK